MKILILKFLFFKTNVSFPNPQYQRNRKKLKFWLLFWNFNNSSKFLGKVFYIVLTKHEDGSDKCNLFTVHLHYINSESYESSFSSEKTTLNNYWLQTILKITKHEYTTIWTHDSKQLQPDLTNELVKSHSNNTATKQLDVTMFLKTKISQLLYERFGFFQRSKKSIHVIFWNKQKLSFRIAPPVGGWSNISIVFRPGSKCYSLLMAKEYILYCKIIWKTFFRQLNWEEKFLDLTPIHVQLTEIIIDLHILQTFWRRVPYKTFQA